MKRTIRALAIGVAVLVSAIPVAATAVLTWNAIDGLISMPQGFIGWSLSYVIWWVGFGAALVFARKLARSGKPWLQLGVVLPLVAGLVAVGWLEVQSWHDPKHVFPVSFFAIPYVLSIAAGWVAHMLSNPPVNADARDVPAHASDRAARAGYRER